jgi:hypothetical protein
MRPVTIPLTISSGTLSDGINCRGRFLSRIVLPAGLASTSISFEISVDGTNYLPARKTDGTTFSITVIPSISVPIPPEITRGAGQLKVKTGSSETNKDFILVLEEI